MSFYCRFLPGLCLQATLVLICGNESEQASDIQVTALNVCFVLIFKYTKCCSGVIFRPKFWRVPLFAVDGNDFTRYLIEKTVSFSILQVFKVLLHFICFPLNDAES